MCQRFYECPTSVMANILDFQHVEFYKKTHAVKNYNFAM